MKGKIFCRYELFRLKKYMFRKYYLFLQMMNLRKFCRFFSQKYLRSQKNRFFAFEKVAIARASQINSANNDYFSFQTLNYFRHLRQLTFKNFLLGCQFSWMNPKKKALQTVQLLCKKSFTNFSFNVLAVIIAQSFEVFFQHMQKFILENVGRNIFAIYCVSTDLINSKAYCTNIKSSFFICWRIFSALQHFFL